MAELPEAVIEVFKKCQQDVDNSKGDTTGGTWVPNECWRVCPCCGRHLEFGWSYCPSCGCWLFHYPYRLYYPAYPTTFYPYSPVWMSAGDANCNIPCAY